MQGLGLLPLGKKDVGFILLNAVRIAPEAQTIHKNSHQFAQKII